MMSHDEFLLGYENGNLGCSVSSVQILQLFLAGRIRIALISRNLLFWLLGFLLLIAVSVIEFLKLHFFGALFCTAVAFGFYALIFSYCFGDLVLSIALVNRDFFELATAERAISIYSDDERNLPKL